ncbi:hypothetical protein ISCGN_002950 [Ixodes scapularis]
MCGLERPRPGNIQQRRLDDCAVDDGTVSGAQALLLFVFLKSATGSYLLASLVTYLVKSLWRRCQPNDAIQCHCRSRMVDLQRSGVTVPRNVPGINFRALRSKL